MNYIERTFYIEINDITKLNFEESYITIVSLESPWNICPSFVYPLKTVFKHMMICVTESMFHASKCIIV